MTLILIALAALVVWTLAVALPLALLIGRAVRLRDQHGPQRESGRKAA